MLNYSFEYPYAFLILIFYILAVKYLKPKKTSFYFPNIHLLEIASKSSNIFFDILKFLIIFLLSFSLASPIKQDDFMIKEDKGYEISLILDVSGSMRENNKFNIVKNIVQDFVQKREHDKIALSIFADFAYVAIPLTYDKASIKRLLEKVDVGIAGVNKTALYEALFISSNLFKNSRSKNKIAILLTDGHDNTNSVPLDIAIKTAIKHDIKVYTIGIGDFYNFNESVLKQIANQTKGEFFQTNSINGLKDIYNKIDTLEKSDIKSDKFIKKTYYFQYPLALGILILCFYFYMINRE